MSSLAPSFAAASETAPPGAALAATRARLEPAGRRRRHDLAGRVRRILDDLRRICSRPLAGLWMQATSCTSIRGAEHGRMRSSSPRLSC